MKKRKVAFKSRKAQVWVETVIYTLIALTVIGLFLSFAKPKIEEIQDKSIIDQSVEVLEDINDIFLSIVQGGSGNQRIIDLSIKKGNLEINSVDDKLVFKIDGRYTYTEPGLDGAPGPEIRIGNIIASTQQLGKLNKVTLISNYSGIYNITYQGKEESKTIGKAPTIYRLSITNEGEVDGVNLINLNLQ